MSMCHCEECGTVYENINYTYGVCCSNKCFFKHRDRENLIQQTLNDIVASAGAMRDDALEKLRVLRKEQG